MLFSKNEFCPVPCMLCKSEDEKGRWTCAWCSLRVCGGCIGRLGEIIVGGGAAARENRVRKEKQREVDDGGLANVGDGSDAIVQRAEEDTFEEKRGHAQNKGEVRDEDEEEDLTLGHW